VHLHMGLASKCWLLTRFPHATNLWGVHYYDWKTSLLSFHSVAMTLGFRVYRNSLQLISVGLYWNLKFPWNQNNEPVIWDSTNSEKCFQQNTSNSNKILIRRRILNPGDQTLLYIVNAPALSSAANICNSQCKN